jgi:hypothetical protein
MAQPEWTATAHVKTGWGWRSCPIRSGDVSRRSLQNSHVVIFSLVVLVSLLLCAGLPGQDSAAKHAARLYLVAATSTEHGPDSYPVTLYLADKSKTLQAVREVVRREDGVRFIYAYGNAIFFPYPHDRPTSVAVLHTDDPGRPDDVAFSSTGVLGAYGELAEPPGTGLEFLLSWLAKPIDPGETIPTRLDVAQAAISSRTISSHARVQSNKWADYAYLRLQGDYGGANPGLGAVPFAQGGNLVLRDSDHPVAIDALPPVLKNLPAGTPLFVFASTDRYLLFCITRTASQMKSENLGSSMTLYVHDRANDRWTTIQTEGNSPGLRLSDDWLAGIVENWSPNHAPNPGTENERTWDEKTERLPPVQRLYQQFGQQEYARPGILVLQNLRDGRKIRIETDQEDSEILWAGDDSVLYRVNDEIYEAKIVGDKLQSTTMIVKDEDVPEIHWVFWSN